MEKNRWSLIFIGLGLALVFSVSPVEAQKDCDADGDGFFNDTNKCRRQHPDEGLYDTADNDCNVPESNPDCDDGGEEDTKTSKKSIPLRMTFDEMEVYGECVDNICSDIDGDYIDNEDRVGVSAAEHSQPNPAAGIHMGLGAKPRIMRQLFLNIICEPIPEFFFDNCDQLPELFDIETSVFLGRGFSGLFPDCGVGNGFCDLGAAVRPYKVDCPEGDPPCPDVFTMDPNTPELMSFRLFFGGRFTFEVASAIGVDGSQDPGTCLSLLTEDELDAFLDPDGTCGDVNNCNVSVEAFDLGGDGENDAWRVVADGADGVTALICDRPGATVIGKATLTFGFDAIKKELAAIDPC